MACQQKTLDDLQKPLQYHGVVLTASTSRQAIREAISASGMTQEGLAEAMKMSPVTVSRWLNGASDPSFAKLDLMAKHLGQPLVLVFGAEHENAPAPTWVRGLQRALAAVLQDRGISPDQASELSEAWAVLERARRQRSPALDAVLLDPDA
jgi:transcriptional regulator with XRE-family HTH domain